MWFISGGQQSERFKERLTSEKRLRPVSYELLVLSEIEFIINLDASQYKSSTEIVLVSLPVLCLRLEPTPGTCPTVYEK